ncbi:MAG: PspC domain-containing protein [Flavobacteriales bacterium]|nr:PspC domain-containing protein [Flavobacteriales bacterium]
MKKTVSINIRGINFMIEEDAYELLQNYLERLNNTLKNEEGSQEIVEDIELRIAEICNSSLTDSKTVIEYNDIQEIIATLGDPEEYLDEDSESNTHSNENTFNSEKSERRLFRDVENGTVAGVCMGIANFLHIDVVIVRAIFVVIFLFAGFGLPLYLILWIIVPSTKSTIDRLRMKGRPITVENVREEVENAAQKIKVGSKKFTDGIRNNDTYSKSISKTGRFFSSLFGIGFIGMGLLFLVILVIFGIGETQIFPVQGDTGFLSMPELGSLVLLDNGDYQLFWWGSIIANSALVMFLLLLGSMLIFRLYNTWAKLSLLVLFVIGITGFIMCATVGMRTGRDFAVTGEIEKSIGQTTSQTLVIQPVLEDYISNEDFKVKSSGNFHMMNVNKKTITFHGIRINYKPSPDSLFHISQNFSVQSHSHKIALEKAENISHEISLKNDTLSMKTGYSYPKTDKIRAQMVKVIIEIPRGGKVLIDGETVEFKSEKDDDDYDYYYEHGELRHNGSYSHWD